MATTKETNLMGNSFFAWNKYILYFILYRFASQPPFPYDQDLLIIFLNSMVKHKIFWFFLLLCHCHVILTLTIKESRHPVAACKILSFFKFDFGLEAGAQLRSWRESACQGKSMLHGKNSPGITPYLQHCGSGTGQGKLERQNGEKVILI